MLIKLIRNSYYKTFGTRVINSPISPPSMGSENTPRSPQKKVLSLQEPYAQSLTQQHSQYTGNLVLAKSSLGDDTHKRKLLVRHRTKLLALHNNNV